MMGESIGGEQCSNLAHLPFSKKRGGEKGRVCGFAAPRTTPLYNYRRYLHSREGRRGGGGGVGWKKGGKCPRRRMDHHYSLTGKITSPGSAARPFA